MAEFNLEISLQEKSVLFSFGRSIIIEVIIFMFLLMFRNDLIYQSKFLEDSPLLLGLYLFVTIALLIIPTIESRKYLRDLFLLSSDYVTDDHLVVSNAGDKSLRIMESMGNLTTKEIELLTNQSERTIRKHFSPGKTLNPINEMAKPYEFDSLSVAKICDDKGWPRIINAIIEHRAKKLPEQIRTIKFKDLPPDISQRSDLLPRLGYYIMRELGLSDADQIQEVTAEAALQIIKTAKIDNTKPISYYLTVGLNKAKKSLHQESVRSKIFPPLNSDPESNSKEN